MVNNFCYIAGLVASFLITLYGFYLVLKEKCPSENDTQVIQRQLRGFCYMMIAQVVLVLGVSLCFNSDNPDDLLRKLIQSLK